MDLEGYYKLNFALIQYHKYSLTEIENLIPWERDVYVSLLQQHLEDAPVAWPAQGIEVDVGRALYFAVLLPVKTVGVMGDGRTYDSVCGLRAVTSTDGMTADVYPFDASFLTQCATRIVNEVQGINRVVYDYTSKPPGTIEWE